MKKLKNTIHFSPWLYLSSDVVALLATKEKFSLNQHPRNSYRSKHLSLRVVTNEENSMDSKSPPLANGNDIPVKKRRQRSRGYPLSAYELDPVPPESRSSIFNPEYRLFDYSRSTRLVQGRSYAKAAAFEMENLEQNPSIQDLSSPITSGDSDRLWSTTRFRFGVLVSSFLALPLITKFLKALETIPLLQLGSSLPDKFGTGISILYGALISLTLSILYDRQKRISSEIAKESAMLVLLTRNVLEIFKEDECRLLDAGDCIANQIRILVKESRGAELLTMIYSDPYIRIMDILFEGDEHVSLNTLMWRMSMHFFFHLCN